MNQPLHGISRRDVLRWGGGTALLTASLSGCSVLSTDPAGTDDGGGAPADTGAKESPMLAERVQQGDLEPLEERLPEEPLVVEVAETGIFGGTFTSVTLGPGDAASFDRIAGYEPPLRIDPQAEEALPNLCTAIEQSEDGTEYTLRFRKGVRWSDGEPFTADDVMFAMTEVIPNTTIFTAPPGYLSFDGKLAEAEKIDDSTVKIIFPQPTGIFLDNCAREFTLVQLPKHYCQQLMPEYNDNVEADAKDAGYDTWADYFMDSIGVGAAAENGRWSNPDLPTLNPWVTKQPLGEGNRVTFERNPYYWKTDPDGRQLPYIDELSYEVVQDPQVMTLKGVDGETSLIYRHVNSPANKPVFARGREDGGYRLVDQKPTSMNTTCIALNLANKDKAKAKLYQNKDFRIGLSHAINREELITGVWQRQGEPWQAAPTSDSIYYDEEFAKQYTEFDTDLANEHLDKAGLTERDGKGFRLMPDGQNLTITLDLATALFEEWPAAADIISGMWADVGIRMRPNAVDRTLFYDRKQWDANDHDAGIWGGDGGLAVEVFDPRWYLPFSDESVWATTWARWYATRGSGGEQPIAAAKKQIELYWQLQQTPEPAEREELFRQILEIAKSEFWVIGLGTSPGPYYVVSNQLKNVPEEIPDTWVYYTPGHANPESWFLDRDA